MEFNKKIYELRKQKGFSQEELASKLNVTRQTVSKWELGDSTPDMEKLVVLSDLFEISLDELVLGKKPELQEQPTKTSKTADVVGIIEEKVLTPKNKKVARQGVKVVAAILGAVLAVDVVSMIIYFVLYGVPK